MTKKKNASPESSEGHDQGGTKATVSPKKVGKPNKGRSDTVVKAQQIETFCQAIMAGKSQSDAYREAYPTTKNWKPESVHNKAYLFAQLGEVRSRLEELAKQQFSRYERDVGSIMERLRDIAFADPNKLFDENGQLLPFNKMPKEVMAALSSVEVGADGKMRTRIISKADQLKAIDLLGKFYKIWTEKHDINFEKPVVQIQGLVITPDMDPVEASRMYRDLIRGR